MNFLVTEPKEIAIKIFRDESTLHGVIGDIVSTMLSSTELSGDEYHNEFEKLVVTKTNEWDSWLSEVTNNKDNEYVLIDQLYEHLTINSKGELKFTQPREYPKALMALDDEENPVEVNAHSFSVQTRNSEPDALYLMHQIMLYKFDVDYAINMMYKNKVYHKNNDMGLQLDLYSKIDETQEHEYKDKLLKAYNMLLEITKYPYTFEIIGEKEATIEGEGEPCLITYVDIMKKLKGSLYSE